MNESAPAPGAFADHLRAKGHPVEVQTEADEQGWFHLELTSAGGIYLLDLYRSEDGIRDDLNTWAAWLEENAGNQAGPLMQRMIGTRQLITLRREDRSGDADARRFCHEVAGWLARQCDGIYQIDGQGFFDSAGTLLVAE